MRRNQFNQTAYRILRLLQWLNHSPLSMDEINTHFEQDPNVQRRLSQDSLWLYVNTLKKLGCEIKRPTPRNQFRYQLIFHPFTYLLTSQDIDCLKTLVETLSDSLDYRDALYFNRWISKVFQHAGNPNREELGEQFSAETRFSTVLSHERFEALISTLEYACQTGQLLEIDYRSSSCKIGFKFLPQRLFQHQSTMYLLGHSLEWEQASMLKLEKIERAVPYDNPSLQALLHQKQIQTETYIVHFRDCSVSEYDSLNEGDEILTDYESGTDLLVKFKTSNLFLLKQKLLASGYRAQVLYPEAFRKELKDSLLEMRGLYVS